MNRISVFYLAFGALFFNGLYGQNPIPEFTRFDSIVSEYWLAGVSLNIVDDSEEGFSTLTSVAGQWNMLPFPSRFSFGKYFRNGLGIELIGSINLYKAGNIINSVVISEDIPYRALDTRISYDINNILGETGVIDPYIGLGFGVSNSSNTTYPTYNAVLGMRLWLSKNWALDLNSSGKWQGLNRIHNHVQHAAGLVYRFGIVEELTKRGAAKLVLRDSMILANKQHEDALKRALEQESLLKLQDEYKRAQAEELQQEIALLAALKRRDSLVQVLEGIGTIRFAFDASTLTKEHETTLNAVSSFMLENPELHFKIQAHTDIRGSAQYNQMLSERRAGSVRSYLLSRGIVAEKLIAFGFGETMPLNDCVQGSYCNEYEHAINRRCTITISD